MVKEKVCGTCLHHERDPDRDEWMCCNPESECNALWTEYQDQCAEWEEK